MLLSKIYLGGLAFVAAAAAVPVAMEIGRIGADKFALSRHTAEEKKDPVILGWRLSNWRFAPGAVTFRIHMDKVRACAPRKGWPTLHVVLPNGSEAAVDRFFVGGRPDGVINHPPAMNIDLGDWRLDVSRFKVRPTHLFIYVESTGGDCGDKIITKRGPNVLIPYPTGAT